MASATAKINIKNIDYFKFKKIVIDGNRDDYSVCSKEVKALCDCVQTLSFRDDEFDAQSDRPRFDEICSYYRQILQSKRIDPLDVRIKSGWWGDHKTGYSAGKIKPTVLMEVLIAKTRDWSARHGATPTLPSRLEESFEGPGLYVFKHKEHQCFQYIEKSNNMFARCSEKLKSAFEGTSSEPLAALLVISMVTDWDFYFVPVAVTDGDRILRILENDLILKHDCVWPHGLNFTLNIDSLLEVSEFRKSCLRHRWPPETELSTESKEIDLKELRKQVLSYGHSAPDKATGDERCNDMKSDRPDSAHGAVPPRKSPATKAAPTPSPAQVKPEPAPSNRPTSSNSSTANCQKSTNFSSHSKLPTAETRGSSATKQVLKSPTKHSSQKQITNRMDPVEPIKSDEPAVEADKSIDSNDATTELDDLDVDGSGVPGRNRSNTFTYSDSESSDIAGDPGSESTKTSASEDSQQSQSKSSKMSAKASAAASILSNVRQYEMRAA